jgi:hypothetical protein
MGSAIGAMQQSQWIHVSMGMIGEADDGVSDDDDVLPDANRLFTSCTSEMLAVAVGVGCVGCAVWIAGAGCCTAV